jgi:shikimate kinase
MCRFILIGMSGCGKSTIGRAVARKMGLQFIDIDEEIESRHGNITDIFKTQGEHRFREIESAEFERALEKDDAMIATGGGILGNEYNRRLASKGTVIFIDRNIEGIRSSLDESNRPMLNGKPGMLEKLFNDRYMTYREAMDFTVENNGTENECIEAVCGLVDKVRRD